MILVYGKSGQVGRELQRLAPEAQYLDRASADLSNPMAAAARITTIRPDVVVNAAAYTKVDLAETERDLAHTVNGDAVGAIARACADLGIPLVHISTDYVFSGNGSHDQKTGETTGPLNVYGQSKLAGEKALRAAGARHAILRTSWVFSAHGQNFVESMLTHGQNNARLSVVCDEIGGPTPAADIAGACLTLAHALLDGHAGGTYHFSGEPNASWADFAEEIFRQTGLETAVDRISSAKWASMQLEKGRRLATRPLNSRLDCSTLEADFGIKRPDWREGLKDVLKDLQNQGA